MKKEGFGKLHSRWLAVFFPKILVLICVWCIWKKGNVKHTNEVLKIKIYIHLFIEILLWTNLCQAKKKKKKKKKIGYLALNMSFLKYSFDVQFST